MQIAYEGRAVPRRADTPRTPGGPLKISVVPTALAESLALNVWNISKLAAGRLSPKYLNGIIGAGLALQAIFSRYQGGRPHPVI